MLMKVNVNMNIGSIIISSIWPWDILALLNNSFKNAAHGLIFPWPY